MDAPFSKTPALPGTTPLSLERLIPSTSPTSWLPPTLSLLPPAIYLASLLAFYSISATNSTSINLLHPFPSPRIEPVALHCLLPYSPLPPPTLPYLLELSLFFSLSTNRTGPNPTGPNRTGTNRTGTNRTGPRSEPIRSDRSEPHIKNKNEKIK
jgi:hypothetical protein